MDSLRVSKLRQILKIYDISVHGSTTAFSQNDLWEQKDKVIPLIRDSMIDKRYLLHGDDDINDLDAAQRRLISNLRSCVKQLGLKILRKQRRVGNGKKISTYIFSVDAEIDRYAKLSDFFGAPLIEDSFSDSEELGDIDDFF